MAIAYVHNGGTNSGKGLASPVGVVGNASVGQIVIVTIALLGNTTITSVTDNGSPPNTYTFQGAVNNGTTDRVEVWASIITTAIPANSIFVSFSGTLTIALSSDTYSGATALGLVTTNMGSSVTPSGSLVIQDANNWVVFGHGFQGVATTFNAPIVGTGRITARTSGGSASSNVVCAVMDNTAVSAGSTVTCSETLSASSIWAGVAVELRNPTGVKAPVWNMPFLPGFGNGR